MNFTEIENYLTKQERTVPLQCNQTNRTHLKRTTLTSGS